jgi:predicted nucleic acid-binding protein
MRFVDTNVLLYAVSTDPTEAAKASIARALMCERDLALSVQVLQEFYVQATRPTPRGSLSHADAAALIETWLRFPVLDLTVPLVRAALAASARWQISDWDAAIVEAARALDCAVLLSEDLQHGQDFDGVKVVDPFR